MLILQKVEKETDALLTWHSEHLRILFGSSSSSVETSRISIGAEILIGKEKREKLRKAREIESNLFSYFPKEASLKQK